jgi:hypothetical protein
MDQCLLANYEYDGRRNAVPIEVNNNPILALRLQDLITKDEAMKLREYAELVFADIDDNRRKKIAKVMNKTATKLICKRIGFKNILINGKKFRLSSYCPEVLIVRWVKEKYLSGVDFDETLNKKYIGNNREQYLTYVISVDQPTSHTTLKIRDNNSDKNFVDVVLHERIAIVYHSGGIHLSEVMSKIDRTHFYFRVKYLRI